MRGWWIVSALEFTACLEPGRVVVLPPELGAREALLVPPATSGDPVLPILGQGGPQPYTLVAPWSEPADLLIYDCPLSTFGIAEMLPGPRDQPAPVPSSWLRLGAADAWTPSADALTDRPLVPSYPGAPSECWRFPVAEGTAPIEQIPTVEAAALVDDRHLLVGSSSGPAVMYQVGATLTVTATFGSAGFVALWVDRPRRRAFWLAPDGQVGVVERDVDRWRSRLISAEAPGFGDCIIREEDNKVIPDPDLELVGTADDEHFELLAVGRCGSVAYFNSRLAAWRSVAASALVPELELPRRVRAIAFEPGEWWISGLHGGRIRHYRALDQGTGEVTPGVVDFGSNSEPTVVMRADDEQIYIGTRDGEVFRWSRARTELKVAIPDKVLDIFAFGGGLVIAGENRSSVFQHQPLAPAGLCGELETPNLRGAERLRELLPLPDGRALSFASSPGDTAAIIHSRISLLRPTPPLSFVCHPPPTSL